LKQAISEIQEGYDKKIEEIEKDTKKAAARLEDRVKVIKSQAITIRDHELRSDIILRDMEEQKSLFQERQITRKIKSDELEKKYAQLQKKIHQYQMNEDLRDIEMKTNTTKIKEQKSTSENIEQQLEIFERKNRDLMNSIQSISTQFSEMQVRDFERAGRSTRSRGNSEKGFYNRK
jgi:hypothetical protein